LRVNLQRIYQDKTIKNHIFDPDKEKKITILFLKEL